MRTVTLGHTDEQVSILCLGTMRFGTSQDEHTSFNLLDQYADAGGMFLDTANMYAHWMPNGEGGDSESLLGRWMKARGNRDQMFIATKVGFGYSAIPGGLTPQQIEEECDKSLTRMGIDTIDLYYAHVDDRETPLRETLEAYNRLVEAGKVRHIGASNYLAYRLERAHLLSKQENWVDFCCLQQRYTYLQPRYGMRMGAQEYVSEEILDYVRARGDFTVLAYSVLLSGAYTRADRDLHEAYANPDNEARLLTLKAIADETGATPNQVVIAWMLQSDPPVLPLIAASTAEQMADNIGALEVTLSEDQMAQLNDARA